MSQAAPIIVSIAASVIVGLNTNPNSDCLGGRFWATNLASALNKALQGDMSQGLDCKAAGLVPGTVAVVMPAQPTFASYSQINPQNALSFYRSNLALPVDISFLWSHSFGGGAAKCIGNSADENALSIAAGDPNKAFGSSTPKVVHLSADPCPNGQLLQWYPWQLADIGEQFRWSAPMSFARTSCIYQRKETIGWLGVCGVPFKDDSNKSMQGLPVARAISVAAAAIGWPELDHVGLATDTRVWTRWLTECLNRVADIAILKGSNSGCLTRAA